MTTKYLKFPDEATAIEVLGQYRTEGEWQTASHTHAIDPVGIIHRPTGNTLTDSEGMEYRKTLYKL